MIIFLHGDDTYRSREKLRELREKFLREVDPSGMNLATIPGTTASASEIWGAIAAQSFLVRKRMIVVEDLGAQKSSEVRREVSGFLDRIPEEAIVVFWESRDWNSASQGRRPLATSRGRSAKASKSTKPRSTTMGDPFFPKLLEGKYTYAFAPLEGLPLTAWVRDRCTTRGALIAPRALESLITEVGSDLWRMDREIEKLTLSALRTASSRASAEREPRDPLHSSDAPLPLITPELVGSLVLATPTENVFGFLDAIGNGDRATALRMLQELEVSGTDPFALIGMLARQVRLLVRTADLLTRGATSAQLAVALRTPPFVARKLADQARRHNSVRLCTLFLALVELDAKLKSSRAPWQALVELFCLEATA